jgi:peroxiredoxin
MNRLVAGIGALVCVALVLGCMDTRQSTAADATAPAKKPVAKKLAVGDAAPQWKELKGTDDKAHSLKDLAKAKAVVVVFTCHHCPVAQAYEGRLAEFAKEYKDKGVELVAINVSLGEADNAEATAKKAKDKGFDYAYLLDPSQDIGRAYGATVTPHVFVLDGKRKVAYMGAFDDDINAAKAKTHWVNDAVDAVLAGKAPEVAVSKQVGCGISYE